MPVSRVRRRTLGTLVWTTPVIALATAAPASAVSPGCPAAVSIATTGLAGNGADLDLRNGKVFASATNTSPGNTLLLNLTLKVTDGAGNALSGATVAVAGDNQTDAGANFVIGFSDAAVAGNQPQSPVKRTSLQTTGAAGTVVVKVSTATFGLADCAAGVPRTGTWSVVASVVGCAPLTVSFTYRVFSPTLVCP